MKTLYFIPFFIFLSFFCLKLTAQTYGTYYVWATSGLKLRETPSKEGKVIASMPAGAPVTYLKSEETPYFQNGTRDGYWRKVRYNQLEGYAFDAYLAWLPHVPSAHTLEAYINAHFTLLSESESIRFSYDMESILEDTGVYMSSLKKLYSHGILVNTYQAYEYSCTAYHIPMISLYQAFDLCKRIKSMEEYYHYVPEFPQTELHSEDFSVVLYSQGASEDPPLREVRIYLGGREFILTQGEGEIIIKEIRTPG